MLMNYSEILKPFWKQIKKKEIPLKVKLRYLLFSLAPTLPKLANVGVKCSVFNPLKCNKAGHSEICLSSLQIHSRLQMM